MNTRERDSRAASVLDQHHRRVCDENNDDHAVVQTCFSIGSKAIRTTMNEEAHKMAQETQLRSEAYTLMKSAYEAPSVNWERLARCLAYYKGIGFSEVSVPWYVAPEISRITCPNEKRTMTIPTHGVLVGSAEQSFLALDKAGILGKGCFVAISPCFRNEDFTGRFHQKHFMKVEVYDNQTVTTNRMEQLVDYARAFFKTECDPGMDLSRLNTDDGVDIILNGVEIGSYGVREMDGLQWVYGTGLAEPRFSAAIAKK